MEKQSSIGFFSTYRPPVPLALYSCPMPPKDSISGNSILEHKTDTPINTEVPLIETNGDTDMVKTTEAAETHDYNGQVIPKDALLTMVRNTKLGHHVTEECVKEERVMGLIFVSERDDGLETLHLALIDVENPHGNNPVFGGRKVFRFSKIYNGIGGGGGSGSTSVRMEDSPCFANISGKNYLIFVSTMEPPISKDINRPLRRQPWTAVYKLNLQEETAKPERLTPTDTADLSPSVSENGTKIAVASFQCKEGGWTGEIENLQTNIFVMNVEYPYNRTMVIKDGGWPTWGSDNVLFFHRKVGEHWAVFRAELESNGEPPSQPKRVTPEDIDTMTPVAIDENTVVVSTLRKKFALNGVYLGQAEEHRHIEIFYMDTKNSKKITDHEINKLFDHYSPFLMGKDNRIGYHRTKTEQYLKSGEDIPRSLDLVDCPEKNVGLFRVPGVFPTFSKDGKSLAYVDNYFRSVWVITPNFQTPQCVHKENATDSVFAPIWSQGKDILYICKGHTFQPQASVQICYIDCSRLFEDDPVDKSKVPIDNGNWNLPLIQLTHSPYNNAFPCTNPDGTKLVFRSTRDHPGEIFKNLYLMDALEDSEQQGNDQVTRLTKGNQVDTHCRWSPRGNYIVFSSSCDKPKGTESTLDNGLDPGYFAVYILKLDDDYKKVGVPVRVMASGYDLSGHVNHPFFSPDMKSIVVTSDLAGVSCDPVSLPLFIHSVRPYGDIFKIDIDLDDLFKDDNNVDPDDCVISKNKEVTKFTRITHSRYENSTAAWTETCAKDVRKTWMKFVHKPLMSIPIEILTFDAMQRRTVISTPIWPKDVHLSEKTTRTPQDEPRTTSYSTWNVCPYSYLCASSPGLR